MIAIGTTNARTLKSMAQMVAKEPLAKEKLPLRPYEGDVDIFIKLGLNFKVVYC